MPADLPPTTHALLLAAGRGERMRPLTDHCPKPLLQVRGKPLAQWHLAALARDGVRQVVINTAWLGDQIEARFGREFGLQAPQSLGLALSNTEQTPGTLQIAYSHEGRDFGAALETAGGVCRALPQLGEVFWVVAGDVFVPDFVFASERLQAWLHSPRLAHLWLVPNPEHNPRGDFGLDPASGLALNMAAGAATPRLTYSAIGLYRRALFLPPWCPISPGNPGGEKAALAPLLRAAMDRGLVSAELYTGAWTDVGTPQRLEQLNA